MKVLLLALVLLAPPPLKRWLLRLGCGATFGRGAQIGWFSAVWGRTLTMSERAVVRPFTLIKLDGDIALGRYSEVSSFTLVYGASDLALGDHSYIGPQCLLNVDAPVRIGSLSALGPRCMLFTHGSWFPATEGYWTRLAGVTLEDRVWCAAGVFLHPGATIGAHSFVNARSVVAQEIPGGSVVEGNPARVTYPIERLKRRMTPAALDATVARIVEAFVEMVVQGEWSVPALRTEQRWHFTYGGRLYHLLLVGSHGANGARGAPEQPVAGVRTVAASTCPGWEPPAGTLVLDFVGGRTPFDIDPVHTALRIFALRYFGVRFEESYSKAGMH